MKTIEIMKKFILTMLAVVGFMHLSYGQDYATVQNNSKCDLAIRFFYNEYDCNNPSNSGVIIISSGGTLVVPVASPEYFITGATVQRVISSQMIFCQPVESISPPPTCYTCNGVWPQTITFPLDGDCCSQVITGTWTELGCTGTDQETLLTFN